ncbi:inner membrane mitochondrial protein mitofilin isoform X2 [Lycorma delicatula]|uniref:inner membrane mitochondrial protein mitofilin isoform X2 n=1 Tax=Lycorma delicatula TaxID=130591 RepID=UPI003F516012
MISGVLKLSSLGCCKGLKHQHINSRIFCVTHCYHQQKRGAHGTHTFRGYIASPVHGIPYQSSTGSLQFVYILNPHIPLCLLNSQHKRFQHKSIQEECEPKKKSKKGFYVAAAVLLVGGVLSYAKYDEDFRKSLEDTVPGTDSFISFIFQEKKSFLSYISDALNAVKDSVADAINSIFGDTSTGGKSAKNLPPCDEEMKPYRLGIERPIKPAEVTDETEKVDSQSPTHPQTLVELEENIGNAAQIAIKNYNDAICVLRDHADEIYNLVETSVEKVDPKIWPQIKAKSEEKEKLVAEAEMNAKVAEKSIHKLKASIENPKLIAPDEMKERAKKNMQKILSDVAEARKAFEKERTKASVTEKYWSKVEEARKHFSEELEILFPNVRLSDKQLKLAEGEIDLFILYAFQNILFYQKELSKLETVVDLKLKQALEHSKAGDPELVKSAVDAEIEKEKRKIQEDFQKRTLELKSECEKDIRNQLRRQAEAHNDHLNEAIALKEKEVERKLARKVEEKIIEERTKFKEELAGMVARLKGLDEAIKKRADQDKNAQQSQALWSACQTLVSTMKNSDATAPPSSQLKPLKDEIKAISKAGDQDELVDTIINSIPKEAVDRGVYTEDALRERFLHVERIASIVSIIPDEGASLPLILLSYLQNLLTIKHPLPIPAYELANEPFDPSSLSTFDILQRARFWMDRGDIAQTLKYMNLLQGGPRAVAKDWIREAQIMLETQQAANVLLTHASASGLVYS